MPKKIAILNRQHDPQLDIRGYRAFDRHHLRIGYITEVYYAADTLKPRYIEIRPTGSHWRIDTLLMYPYDSLSDICDNSVFLDVEKDELAATDFYSARNMLERETERLLSFSEANDKLYAQELPKIRDFLPNWGFDTSGGSTFGSSDPSATF